MVREAVEGAMALLGNANNKAIFERQRMILAAIHPDLTSYASHQVADPASITLFGPDTRERIRSSVDFSNELNNLTRTFNSGTGKPLNERNMINL